MRRQADVKTRTCRSAAKLSTAKKKRLKGKCKAANIHEPAALQPLRAAALPPYRHREEQRPSARSVVVVDQHKRAALPVEKKKSDGDLQNKSGSARRRQMTVTAVDRRARTIMHGKRECAFRGWRTREATTRPDCPTATAR